MFTVSSDLDRLQTLAGRILAHKYASLPVHSTD